MPRSFIPQVEPLGPNPPLRKKLAHAFGMAVGFGLAISAEAAFVWWRFVFYEVAGQLKQLSALAATALNVPAAQADTLPPLPVYPASAMQSVKATLPVPLPVPELDGQSVQAASLFADALYVPAAHGVQLSEAVCPAYSPKLHGKH